MMRLILATRAEGRYLRWINRPSIGYAKRSAGSRSVVPRISADTAIALERSTNPWLTLQAVAGYLALSPSTVRGLMKGPDPLPSFTVGRSRRFSMRSVDAWMRRREAREDAVEHELEILRARRRA
jgi:predicted DNA-binding transcriptional regulator AlpA